MVEFRFIAEPSRAHYSDVTVQCRSEDGHWSNAGALEFTADEWEALREAIMLGGAGVIGMHFEEVDTWPVIS